MVSALVSHQCGPGSNPGVGAICGLSLLLVLSFAPRGFCPGTPVFPSTQKPPFPNFNSTRSQVDEEPLCRCATSKSSLLLFYYCILQNGQQIKQEYVRTELTVCCIRFYYTYTFFLCLIKNCTEPYLVRYVEALYIYTQIKIVQFLSVNPSKNSPYWSNINMQKVFRKRYALFMFNL